MINRITFLLITLFSVNTFAVDYQIDANTWSFDLITETCPEALAEAVKEAAIPAHLSIVYPKTMGFEYFSILLFEPGKTSPTAELQFKYWADYTGNGDEYVCENVSAEDYVY